MLPVILLEMVVVFESLLYTVVVGLLTTGIQLLDARMPFWGLLYAVLFKIALISFFYALAMSVSNKNITNSNMVELELFASCRDDDIVYLSETNANVRLILVYVNFIESLVLKGKDENISIFSVVLP